MRNKILLFLAFIVVLAIVVITFIKYFSNEGRNSNQNPQEDQGVESIGFEFPEDIGTAYVHTVDWPPQVRAVEEPYSCTEAGNETDRAGKTEERIINGDTYCITTIAEGAAGSVYRQYAYSFSKDSQTVFLTFSLRFPQCGNYSESEKARCEEEQSSFDPDSLVERGVLDSRTN